MSPELIAPERFGSTKFRPTKSSDCYAFGMVIYEAISGEVPFYTHKDFNVLVTVLAGGRPARCVGFTDHLWKMLERCWAYRPDDRPSTEEVLQCLREFPKLPKSPTTRTDRDPESCSDDQGLNVPLSFESGASGTMVIRGVTPMAPDLDYVTDRGLTPIPSASCPSTVKADADGTSPTDPNTVTTTSAFEGVSLCPPYPVVKMLTAHDPAFQITTLACERLIKRAFVVGELPSLIEAILSSRDDGETIRRLPRDDAQSLIDVVDEARFTFSLWKSDDDIDPFRCLGVGFSQSSALE